MGRYIIANVFLSWTVNSQVFTMSSSFITGYIDFEEINVT